MTGRGGDGAPALNGVEPGAVLHSEQVHSGRVLQLSLDTVRFPDGTSGTLEMARHSGAAAVLPFLSAPEAPDPTVVLIRQWRYAASGYLLEVPAGRPAYVGEPWADCARRELQEETGYAAGRLEPLSEILTAPGFTDERIRLFAAWDLSPGAQRLDPDEYVELVPMLLSEALQRIETGEIVDAKSVCTLLIVAGKQARGGWPVRSRERVPTGS